MNLHTVLEGISAIFAAGFVIVAIVEGVKVWKNNWYQFHRRTGTYKGQKFDLRTKDRGKRWYACKHNPDLGWDIKPADEAFPGLLREMERRSILYTRLTLWAETTIKTQDISLSTREDKLFNVLEDIWTEQDNVQITQPTAQKLPKTQSTLCAPCAVCAFFYFFFTTPNFFC